MESTKQGIEVIELLSSVEIDSESDLEEYEEVLSEVSEIDEYEEILPEVSEIDQAGSPATDAEIEYAALEFESKQQPIFGSVLQQNSTPYGFNEDERILVDEDNVYDETGVHLLEDPIELIQIDENTNGVAVEVTVERRHGIFEEIVLSSDSEAEFYASNEDKSYLASESTEIDADSHFANFEFECEDTEPMNIKDNTFEEQTADCSTKEFGENNSEEDEITMVDSEFKATQGSHQRYPLGIQELNLTEQENQMNFSPASASSFVVVENTNQRVEKRHHCDFMGCKARFSTASYLKRHKFIHTEEKPFICDLPDCGRRFAWKHHLTAHKRTHTGEKPYACDWPECKQRFAHSSLLITHKRTHTGEKPYKCNWPNCGQRFSVSGNLIEHKRTHTGEKPYICDWSDCGQRFSQSGGLRNHKITHTGEKPYICDWEECRKGFSTSSGLSRHKKTHTSL